MNKNEKPVIFLEGTRIYLRPPQSTDLEIMVRWMNDPDVRQYIMSQFPMTIRDEERWYEALDHANPRTNIVLPIILKRGHRLIGTTGIHRINWINRCATTGAILGEVDCRDKRYGSEAKALVLEYAFQTLGLHRINSAILSTNLRSLAYLKRAGYTVDGRRKDAIFHDGKWIDEILLGILADDWRKAQK